MSKEHPRVFVSYSQTSDEYQRRVVDLAERLVTNGVDVVIDVWDLKPGNDKFKFMERCVTDEGIEKVLILCDRRYAEKADGREGGVGDETAVITPEVYDEAEQQKFIPVVMELGEDKEAFLPAYLKRIMWVKHVNLSGDAYEQQFEELLRCIYDQPKYVKPVLGSPPAWLTSKVPVPEPTGTSGLAERERAAESLPTLHILSSAPMPKETGAPEPSSKVPVRSFPEYSWAELKSIADEIAAASDYDSAVRVARHYCLVDDEYRLSGDDTRLVMLNDGSRALIRIAGFRHDDTVESGGKVKAGITFEFANVPLVHCMNPESRNTGGWEKSEMRGWLNDVFYELLPHELRSGIVRVRKRTNNRGGDVEGDTSAVTYTKDKLWLFSMSEVYGNLSRQRGPLGIFDNVPDYPAVYDEEGRQYKFYRDHKVSVRNYGSCKKAGADSWWWLRSPGARDSNYFRSVCSDGGWGYGRADGAGGVSPGFCF